MADNNLRVLNWEPPPPGEYAVARGLAEQTVAKELQVFDGANDLGITTSPLTTAHMHAMRNGAVASPAGLPSPTAPAGPAFGTAPVALPRADSAAQLSQYAPRPRVPAIFHQADGATWTAFYAIVARGNGCLYFATDNADTSAPKYAPPTGWLTISVPSLGIRQAKHLSLSLSAELDGYDVFCLIDPQAFSAELPG